MNMTDKYKIRDLILFSMLSILFYLLSINCFPLIVFVIPSLFIVLGIKRIHLSSIRRVDFHFGNGAFEEFL